MPHPYDRRVSSPAALLILAAATGTWILFMNLYYSNGFLMKVITDIGIAVTVSILLLAIVVFTVGKSKESVGRYR